MAKRTGKAASKTTKEEARAQGSHVPVADRAWPHRVVDHVIAQERELGSTRRPPAVNE